MKNLLQLLLLLPSLSLLAQTKKLKVEPNHSTLGFNISIAGFTKVTGKFTDYEIILDWNDKDLDSCSVLATIKVESINTGIPDRDAHLRTADFFDIEKFPNITFQSDSIRQVNYSNFEAHGKLSMHGVTKNIILPFQIVKIEKNTIGISSITTLNRMDYGVGSGFNHSSMPDFLSKMIEFECYFWTKKRKE
jgi:polyisoprenoid-binding protein YceI